MSASGSAKAIRWIAPIACLVAIGCSLSAEILHNRDRQTAGEDHRQRLSKAINAVNTGEIEWPDQFPQYVEPPKGLVASALQIAGASLFLLFTVALVAIKSSRSHIALFLWLAWVIPFALADLAH